MGDIRVKRLIEGEAIDDGWDWQPVEGDTLIKGDFELRGTFTLSDGGAASLSFQRPMHGTDGFVLVLDHTSAGSSRTGTIQGYAPITTQFLQPGVPFDLLLRSEGSRLKVFLNGVMINSVDNQISNTFGAVLLNGEVIPGTQFEVKNLEHHSF